MVSSNIKVIIRVRPCKKKPSPAFQLHADQNAVTFELEKHDNPGEINNQKTSHTFRFDGILPMTTTQEEVFAIIAKPVIEDVLNGVNGTIFAYGQTGSGKTFTITGGAERFADRGLIPRTISHMFESFRKSKAQFKMYVSYLEIYQNAGYDLLRDDTAQKLEDLPKVQLREDEDGNMHLRNLSVNMAASEEDALNLLFMGDTNRIVAETPMNDASTRSHCLFIIWVDSTAEGSDVVRRSKLHLVDLAGSERVSNTGVEGKLLTEAKAINLSLHYLERVIVALHAKSKGGQTHVPYRDSMMTSVLRDSLGGNCKTTMVGCMATEPSNIAESIATCHFAQRVAQIKNNAKVNEELDPNLLIARLKRELVELKKEVQVARNGSGEGGEENLTEEDVEQCRALVLQYVSNKASSEPFVCGSVERLRVSFRILRNLCLGATDGGGGGGGDGAGEAAARGGGAADPARKAALEAEIRKLRLEVAQRDQEISVMVQMLSKQRQAEGRPFIPAAGPGAAAPGTAQAAADEVRPAAAAVAEGRELPGRQLAPNTAAAAESAAAAAAAAGREAQLAKAAAPPIPAVAATPAPGAGPPARPSSGNLSARGPRRAAEPRGPALPPGCQAEELLLDKKQAFDVFRDKVYCPPASFEENKSLLREKILKAKALGEEVNTIRSGINGAKTCLERLRAERAMTNAGGDDMSPEDGPEELAQVQEIERLKAIYRERTSDLRSVKSEVEFVQRMLEQNKVRMQKEFETWFAGIRQHASVGALDEERKKELYAKVTGASGAGTPVGASAGAKALTEKATSTPAGDTSTSKQVPESRSSPPRQPGPPPPRPAAAATAAAAAAARVEAVTGDSQTDDEIAKYYAALGDLAKSA